jgi:hypothetical protein
MLKLLVLLLLLTPTTLAQTTNLQSCEGLFDFFKTPEIEGYPQAREIPVSVLVKALSILDPDHTFDPKSLMQESDPKVYNPNATVIITCSGEAFFFSESSSSEELNLIIYFLPERTFVKLTQFGYLRGAWPLGERYYVIELLAGDVQSSKVIVVNVRNRKAITMTGDEPASDASNWFIADPSAEGFAAPVVFNQKFLVVDDVWSKQTESIDGLTRFSLSLYEIKNNEPNKLGSCLFQLSQDLFDFSFNLTLTDSGLIAQEQNDEKTNNSQLLPECQQLADLMRE